MQPRTLMILVVLILAGAVGLRFLVVQYDLLPTSEEALLKRAVAVTVQYKVLAAQKSLIIADPVELSDLLQTLRFNGDEPSYYGKYTRSSLTFRFPNGRSREIKLGGPQPYRLGNQSIDRAFYDKLCEIVARHEGQAVDVLDLHPVAVPPPKGLLDLPPAEK
jgi:hypothetical protein